MGLVKTIKNALRGGKTAPADTVGGAAPADTVGGAAPADPLVDPVASAAPASAPWQAAPAGAYHAIQPPSRVTRSVAGLIAGGAPGTTNTDDPNTWADQNPSLPGGAVRRAGDTGMRIGMGGDRGRDAQLDRLTGYDRQVLGGLASHPAMKFVPPTAGPAETLARMGHQPGSEAPTPAPPSTGLLGRFGMV